MINSVDQLHLGYRAHVHVPLVQRAKNVTLVLRGVTSPTETPDVRMQFEIFASRAKVTFHIDSPGLQFKGQSVPARSWQSRRIPTIYSPFHAGAIFKLQSRVGPEQPCT
jgi:hypothetical protein